MKKSVLLGMISILTLTGACRRDTEGVRPEQYPKSAVRIVAPAGPGSGYDLTSRSIAKCLKDLRLVSVPLPVINKPGGGGSVALAYLAENRAADDLLAVFSPPLCLINLNGSTELSYLNDTTPVAMIITDFGLFAVNNDSPYQSLDDIMQALKRDPKSIRIGGISAPGSMDHIQFLQIAHKAGVKNLGEIEYTGYQDGSVAAHLMSGSVDLISTGISDTVGLVESGDIRALAITSDKPVGKGIVAKIPTCIDQGIDATFYNWRGVFGPKDMPEYAVEYWESVLSEMAQTDEWSRICEKFGWDLTFYGHEEFAVFLEQANSEYETLLREVGMTE